MTKTKPKIIIHPIDHGDHDGECTEGLSDEVCQDTCTPLNKRLGICTCKRSEKE